MKNKHIFIPLIVFVSVCFVGLIISIISFKAFDKNMNYSSKTIEFLYDGASDGKDPDGNEFNANDLLTEEVINKAVTESGMSYKYEDIRPYIVMSNIVPADVVSEITSYTSLVKSGNATTTINSSTYHPTRYSIILYRDFDKKISGKDLNKLVDNISKYYCELFYNTYKKSFDSENYSEIYSMDNYDYIYQVEVYQNKLEALSKFAKSLFAKNNTFTFKAKTFNDIALKADSLVSNEVSKIRNSIIYNALSKDVERLKDYYNYKITNLQFDKNKYETDLVNIDTQITEYKKDSTVYIGTGENVVKIDSNSSETYNHLLARKLEISQKISQINTSITDYNQILTDIAAATATQTEYDKVEASIEALDASYDELEASFVELINGYNEYNVYNGAVNETTAEYHNNTSLFSLGFIVKALKVVLPMAGITGFGICVFYIIWEIKKSKKKELELA